MSFHLKVGFTNQKLESWNFLVEGRERKYVHIPAATAGNTAPVPTDPHLPCSILQNKNQELETIITKSVPF